MFEYAFDSSANLYRPLRITQKISHQTNASGVRQFDEHDQIRTLLAQRRVDRMPHAFIAVNDAVSGSLRKTDIKAVTTMADPFRPPLPGVATLTLLNPQSFFLQAFPVGTIEAIGRRSGLRQTGIQIGRHNTASLPNMQALTGVTIGPEMTIDTLASGT